MRNPFRRDEPRIPRGGDPRLLSIWTIWDKTANLAGPVHLAHDIPFLRQLKQELNTGDTMLSKFPKEFQLRKLALLNPFTGEIQPFPHENQETIEIEALITTEGATNGNPS